MRPFDPAEIRRLARLAAPVVLAHVGFMLLGVTDTVMVGRYDAGALAGVALGHAWTWWVMIVVRGAAIGLDPLVTQAIGARDAIGYRRALAHGVLLVTLLAVPAVGVQRSAALGLTLLHQPADAIPLAADYAAILGFATWTSGVEAVLRQGLQAQGRVRAPLIVALVGNLCNVPLNALFLHGAGPVPALGAPGVAYASLIVQLVMSATLFAIAREDARAALRGLREVGLRSIARVAALAVPVALNLGLETWAFGLATVIVGWSGTDAVAAHTVALNVASLAFMVPLGISSAASTRVGNLLGAGLDWTRAAWTAVAMGGSVMAASSFALLVASGAIAGAYLPRPEDSAVRELAAGLIPVAALFQVFDGVQVVSFGVLRGAGDTRVPAVANVVGYYAVGLPLGAWLLDAGWGPRGVWVGLCAALAIVASLLVVRIVQVARLGGFRRSV